MQWNEIRSAYPDQWLVIEALEAYTTPDGRRQFDCLAVVETCPEGDSAMRRYRYLHKAFPQRELYFIHTGREELDIRVRYWHGVRAAHATEAA